MSTEYENPFMKEIGNAEGSLAQFNRVNKPGPQKITPEAYIASFSQKLKSVPSALDTYGGEKAFYGDSEMNLSFERYYSHPSFNQLGFSPWRENESLYNQESGWASDMARGLKVTGQIIALTAWDNKPFLSTLDLFDPLDYEEETAAELSRLMKIGTSTRGGVGGFATNFFVNSGITLGIVASALAESAAIGAMGTFGAAPTGGASIPVAGAGILAKLGSVAPRLTKMFQSAKLLSKIGSNADDLKRVFDFSKQAAKLDASAAANFFNPLSNVTKLMAESPETFKNLNTLAKTSQSFGAFYRDARNMAMVVNEAQLEGGLVLNQMTEDFIRNEYYKTGEAPTIERMQAMREGAEKAAFWTTMINLPLIHFSNKVVLDNILAPTPGLQNLLRNLEAGKAIGYFKKGADGYKHVGFGVKSILHTAKPMQVLGNTLNYTRRNFMDALQENAQEATSAGVINYYTKLFENPYINQNRLLNDSIKHGLSEQFTGQGLETFFSGFLTGGLVGNIGNLFQWSYSKYNQLQDKEKWATYVQERDTFIKSVENSLNFLDKNFLDLGSGFDDIIPTNLVNAGQQSAASVALGATLAAGNIKFTKDIQDLGLFEHVYNALRVGKFDELIKFNKDLMSLSDVDLVAAYPTSGLSADKLREKLNTANIRSNRIKERFEKYSKYQNPISVATMDQSTPEYAKMVAKRNAIEQVRKLLIMSEEDYTRGVERMDSIANGILAVLPEMGELDSTEVLSFLDPMKVAQVHLPRLRTEIKAEEERLKSGVLNAADKKEVEEKLELLKQKDAMVVIFNQKLLDFRKSYKEKKEFTDVERSTLYDIFKKYLGVLNSGTNSSPVIQNEASLQKVFEDILDYALLSEENKVLGAAINVMQDPDGFAKTTNDLTEYLTSVLLNAGAIAEMYSKAMVQNEENALLNYMWKEHTVVVNTDSKGNYIFLRPSKNSITQYEQLDENDPELAQIEDDYYTFKDTILKDDTEKKENKKKLEEVQKLRLIRRTKNIEKIKAKIPGATDEFIEEKLKDPAFMAMVDFIPTFSIGVGVESLLDTKEPKHIDLEKADIPQEAKDIINNLYDVYPKFRLSDDIVKELEEKKKNATPEEKVAYDTFINRIEEVHNSTGQKSLYINIETGKAYIRVTSFLDPGKGDFKDRVSEKGIKVDSFVRGFFLNALTRAETESAEWSSLYEYLLELREEFEKRGETVIPSDVIFTSSNIVDENIGLPIAGTPDLLTVDKEGKFRIYDVKSSGDRDLFTITETGTKYDTDTKYGKTYRESHTQQLNVYREVFIDMVDDMGEGYEADVVKLEVIPVHVTGNQTVTKTLGLPRIDIEIRNITQKESEESEESDTEVENETLEKGEEIVIIPTKIETEEETVKTEIISGASYPIYTVGKNGKKGKKQGYVKIDYDTKTFVFINKEGEIAKDKQKIRLSEIFFTQHPNVLFDYWWNYVLDSNAKEQYSAIVTQYSIDSELNIPSSLTILAQQAVALMEIVGPNLNPSRNVDDYGSAGPHRAKWFAKNWRKGEGLGVDEIVTQNRSIPGFFEGIGFNSQSDEGDIINRIKDIIRETAGYSFPQLHELSKRSSKESAYQDYNERIIAETGVPLSVFLKKLDTITDPFDKEVHSGFEGKLIYATPGSGKTQFVLEYKKKSNPRYKLVDVDDLLLERLEDLYKQTPFEITNLTFTNENLADLIIAFGTSKGYEDAPSYEPELYGPVRKQINDSIKEGAIVLTGTQRFIEIADYVVVAQNRDDRLKDKGIEGKQLEGYKELENSIPNYKQLLLRFDEYIGSILTQDPLYSTDKNVINEVQQYYIQSIAGQVLPGVLELFASPTNPTTDRIANFYTLHNMNAVEWTMLVEYYKKLSQKPYRELFPNEQDMLLIPYVSFVSTAELDDFNQTPVLVIESVTNKILQYENRMIANMLENNGYIVTTNPPRFKTTLGDKFRFHFIYFSPGFEGPSSSSGNAGITPRNVTGDVDTEDKTEFPECPPGAPF